MATKKTPKATSPAKSDPNAFKGIEVLMRLALKAQAQARATSRVGAGKSLEG